MTLVGDKTMKSWFEGGMSDALQNSVLKIKTDLEPSIHKIASSA